MAHGIDPDALAALVAAGGQNDITKLPLFYGDKAKDQLTAELWAQRVDTARAGVPWNDAATMAHVYASLRHRASAYHNFIRQRQPDLVATWAAFRPRFLKQFQETQTSVASVALFDGLKQRQDETVLDFSLRVGRAIHELKSIRPPLAVPAAAADIEGINAALTVAGTAAHARALYVLGVDRSANHVNETIGAQFLLAGLRPDIRIKVTQIQNYQRMSFLEMSDAASDIETNMKEPANDGTKAVAVLDTNDAEVNGVRFGRYNGHRGGRGSSRSRGRGRGSSQNNGSRFNGTCYNCQKPGHKKAECRSAPRNTRVHATDMDYTDNQVGTQPDQEYYEEYDEVDELGQVQVGTLDYLN